MDYLSRSGRSSRSLLTLFALATTLPTIALLLPLCTGVWLPDLWGGSITVARAQTVSGHRFQIEQKWGADFYTTELVHTLPNGSEQRGLIDGDADKWWSARIQIEESSRHVTVNGMHYQWPDRDRMLLMPLPTK